MKFLKVLLIVFIIVLGVGLVLSLVVDGKFDFERSVTVDACSSDVEEYAFGFNHWAEWGPWNVSPTTGENYEADYKYFGESMAIGSGYSWNGDSLGAGSVTITAFENNTMSYELSFTEPHESKSDGWISVQGVEDGYEVRWGTKGELGIFPKIFMMFGPSMEDMVGSQFEIGLNNLKEITEAIPQPEMVPAEKTMEAVHYIGKMYEINVADLEDGSIHRDGFGAIMGQMTALGADYSMASYPFARWHEFDEETMNGKMELGIPVTTAVEAGEGFTSGTMDKCQALVGTHMGSFEKLGDMWGSMEAYVACSGAPIGGAPYALYITDPTTQPDTSLWQTDIVYPIMPPMAKHSEGEGHDHEHGDADHGDSEEHDHEEGDGNEADTE